jgi:RNA polymerase sigma factor (sigma-70 family)
MAMLGERQSRSRDDDAWFRTLFGSYFHELYRYVRRRVGPDIAEDLASETFARAFSDRRRYRADLGDPKAWLYGIATNLVRRQHRQEERQLRAFARTGVDPVTEELDPSWMLGSGASGPAVSELLADLPVEERDVLLLFAWADLSYEQIADGLGLPIGTVRSRLNRVRATLRERLPRETSAERPAGGIHG